MAPPADDVTVPEMVPVVGPVGSCGVAPSSSAHAEKIGRATTSASAGIRQNLFRKLMLGLLL